jgi:hypothetical protein
MGILLDFTVGFRMTGCESEAIQLSHSNDDTTGWTTPDMGIGFAAGGGDFYLLHSARVGHGANQHPI